MRLVDDPPRQLYIAVDPGSATGLAEWNPATRALQTFDLPAMQAVDWINGELWAGGVELVVCEAFTITQKTLEFSRGGSNDAIEVIGAARWLARQYRVTFELQQPAEAKGFSSNEKLKRAGFVTPASPDHRRSAARHLLLGLVRHQVIDPATLVQ